MNQISAIHALNNDVNDIQGRLQPLASLFLVESVRFVPHRLYKLGYTTEWREINPRRSMSSSSCSRCTRYIKIIWSSLHTKSNPDSYFSAAYKLKRHDGGKRTLTEMQRAVDHVLLPIPRENLQNGGSSQHAVWLTICRGFTWRKTYPITPYEPHPPPPLSFSLTPLSAPPHLTTRASFSVCACFACLVASSSRSVRLDLRESCSSNWCCCSSSWCCWFCWYCCSRVLDTSRALELREGVGGGGGGGGREDEIFWRKSSNVANYILFSTRLELS